MSELTQETKVLLNALVKKHLENIEAIQRVRELHTAKVEELGLFCLECSDEYLGVEYPCPTIQALDGEQ